MCLHWRRGPAAWQEQRLGARPCLYDAALVPRDLAECINTFDAHDDKAWALSPSGPSGALLATGGGDGAVAVWEDCTAADAAEAAAEAAAQVLQQQELANALKVGRRARGVVWAASAVHARGLQGRPVVAARPFSYPGSTPFLLSHLIRVLLCAPPLQDEDYERAAALAFRMRHPGRLLGVVRAALERGAAEGPRILSRLAGGWGPDDLRQCLEYVR